VIHGLNFATNSADIEPASKSRLDVEVLPVLASNPDVRIRIDGHTDSRGADAYHQGLSERRAESVRSYFVSKGIDGSRLEAHGFGETQPIAPNDTAENLQKNRRTELTPIGE
jgi:OOP family OmpA-OmpF porin